MLKISLDEGFVYDYLAILQVKEQFAQNVEQKKQLKDQINQLSEEINLNIGYELAIKVYRSDEYKKLYDINFDTFVAIDDIKTGKGEAIDIDKLNYQRFLAKKELQRKFFHTEGGEIKIGYDSWKK